MASTRFYLDMRNRARDERGTLRIMIELNGTITSVSTGLRLLHSQWRGGKITGIPDAEAVNATVMLRKAKIESALFKLVASGEADSMTAAQAKAAITGTDGRNLKDRKQIASIFNEYVKDAMRPHTRTLYGITLKKVLAYGGDRTSIDDIDVRWLRGFDRFLSGTCRVNTRGLYLRMLRTICRYALNSGITDRYAYAGYRIAQEQTAKRSVPIEDMRRLLTWPCTAAQSKYRDLFFLMFFLIGINAADLFNARPRQVTGGRLEYERAKTGKRYSVKIEPEADAIIGRYRGVSYLLDVMECGTSLNGFMHTMNGCLGKIGRTTVEEFPTGDLFAGPEVRTVRHPVVPGLTTYYARHSWATYAYDIGISTDIIAQALGHSNGSRTTMIYIRPDRNKVDEANRAVIDYLLMGK